jgi:hypothetical protein
MTPSQKLSVTLGANGFQVPSVVIDLALDQCALMLVPAKPTPPTTTDQLTEKASV